MKNGDEIAALISAAEAWASAMDVVAEAQEQMRPAGDGLDQVEAAEILLYAAVLDWRKAKTSLRH